MFPGFSRAPRQRGAREEGWDQELAPGKAWAAPLGWKGRGRGADILGELLHPEPLLELGFQVCLALAQILLCDFPSLTTPLWSCRLWQERTGPEQEVRLVFSVRCVVWPQGLGTLSSNTEMMVVPMSPSTSTPPFRRPSPLPCYRGVWKGVCLTPAHLGLALCGHWTCTGRLSPGVCLPGPRGLQNRAREAPYSAKGNKASEPRFFSSHLTILPLAGSPHRAVPCVSAAPSDPLECSDLKLRRSTQVVTEGRADGGNAKPASPSHPRGGGRAPLTTECPGLASLPVTAGGLPFPGLWCRCDEGCKKQAPRGP